MPLNNSNHVQKRIRQRGFNQGDMDLITRYGTPLKDREGELFFLRRRDVGKVIGQLKKMIQKLERLSGSAVVIGQNQSVVTAYHADENYQKKLLQRGFCA